MKGLLLFLREIITNPSAVGAAWPSSNKLAQAMTQNVTPQPGFVLELGAGTGVITKALLNCEITEQQLIVLERSPALAQHLRNHFPKLQIITGDALELADLTATQKPIHTIISSLPLRTWSNENIEKIGNALDKVLSPNGLFVQFTYSLLSKPLVLSTKLKFIKHQYIFWNLPPARIDVFRHVTN
jgi:phospholipid N-methyltransferase